MWTCKFPLTYMKLCFIILSQDVGTHLFAHVGNAYNAYCMGLVYAKKIKLEGKA